MQIPFSLGEPNLSFLSSAQEMQSKIAQILEKEREELPRPDSNRGHGIQSPGSLTKVRVTGLSYYSLDYGAMLLDGLNKSIKKGDI